MRGANQHQLLLIRHGAYDAPAGSLDGPTAAPPEPGVAQARNVGRHVARDAAVQSRLESRVGRGATRFLATSVAAWMISASRSRASSRFRAWSRNRRAWMTRTPAS